MKRQLKQFIIYLILIALISIFVYWYFFQEQDNEESQTRLIESTSTVSQVNENQVNQLQANKNITAKSISSDVETSTFESIKSAEEAMLFIQQLFDNGKDGLAMALLGELHGRCGYTLDEEAPHKETSWAHEKTLRYCKGYSPVEYETRLNEAIENPINRPDFMSMSYDSEETDIDVLSENYLSLLTQMESRISLSAASGALAFFSNEIGTPLQLGQDSNMNPIDVYDVQNFALDIYACERFGGCDSEGYLTLNACVHYPQCQPGWSLIDVYQNILSPYNFEQLMNIVAYMRSSQLPRNH